MRGVRISGLELDSDGSVAVEKLATIFEDGEVDGDSYLASSLRKSVEERGPMPLDRVIKLYNNGYFGAAWMYKGRVYIKEDSEAPKGARIQEGPRGGKYYETQAGRGRPLKGPEEGYVPQDGERVRFAWPGDRLNGKLARVEESGGKGEGRYCIVSILNPEHNMRTVQIVDVKHLVPAPYTAKEKREMKAKDIMVQEFGKVDWIQTDKDPVTKLSYNIHTTEAGPLLWVKRKGEFDQPWMVQADSGISMSHFMKALPHMNMQALASLKTHVNEIIFSPVGNPNDRATSKRIGSRFVSAASIDMNERIMHIWPGTKKFTPERLAKTLTHETGHAMDSERANTVQVYNDKLSDFWKTQEHMPAASSAMREIERTHGIPPHPNAWMEGYSHYLQHANAMREPDKTMFWGWFPLAKQPKRVAGPGGWPPADAQAERGVMIGEKSWNELSKKERKLVMSQVNRAKPVSLYAKTNDKEYYAEAYAEYHLGRLDKRHVLHEHFEALPKILEWVSDYEPQREEVPWPAD